MIPVDKDLLDAMAAEATEARARLERSAAAVGDWVAALPHELRQDAVAGAQGFDEIGQRLEVLASLLKGLARGEDADALVAAAPLADMAARLAGAPSTAPATSGDLLLFE